MNRMRNIALALTAVLAAGCVENDTLRPPANQVAPGIPLLARYVALGNSITAGVQSGGINDSVQRRAYPVLLARMASVPFTYQSFGAGCTALYTSPLNSNGKLTATIPGGCDLSRTGFATYINNLGIPGETVADLTATGAQSGLGPSNPLSTFILGGLNEIQAMMAVKPTFVSLWAPNNDVLGPVNLGDTTAMPTTTAYLASFQHAVDSMKALPSLQGAALIGLVDVPRVAPIVQPGAYFFIAYSQNPAAFGGKTVDASCSPVNALGQANPFGANLVSFHVLADPTVTTIACTPGAKYVTTTSVAGAAGGTPELNVFETRIAAINTGIKAIADANGWVYIDPNAFLGSTALANTTYFKKCQALATATPATLAAAFVASCPMVDPNNPFGTMITLDATHPSTLFHQMFASYLATQINAKYATGMSTTAPTTF